MTTFPLVKYVVPRLSRELSPGAGCKWWVVNKSHIAQRNYGSPIELTEEDILKVAALNGLPPSTDIEGLGATGIGSENFGESFFLMETDG